MATFNTTAFADTIPNLAKTFGDNKPIDMAFSLTKAPKIQFKDASFTENARTVGKADFDVLWSVEGKPAFTLRTSDAQFGVSIAIQDFNLSVQLTDIYIDSMSVHNSTIGQPDPDFQSIANFIDIGA